VIYPCGCVNQRAECGALRSYSKCAEHKRAKEDMEAGSDFDYYRSIGCVDDDMVMSDEVRQRYVHELNSALLLPVGPGACLEVGCGLSPYVPLLRDLQWTYQFYERRGWAASWMGRTYRVEGFIGEYWPEHFNAESYDLIMMMHVLEHLDDAPDALARTRRIIRPGGHLVVLVPDDSDLVNPDHQWFFTESSLKTCLETACFDVKLIVTKRVIERERFIYCLARRPS
jgi:SAM-dependent methyltransferase